MSKWGVNMANQLTRIIMENIVDKYTDNKRGDIQKTHLSNREENIIRNIIHKESNRNLKIESKIKCNSKDSNKCITLDELISKSIGSNQEESSLRNEKAKDLYSKRHNKVSLEDIAPKVSLTSIGKKT